MERVRPGRVLRLLAVCVILLSALGFAQQPAPSQAAGKASTSGEPSPQEKEREIQKREQSQRMLKVVPMFTVTDRQNAPPLTSRQKFHLFAKSTFDPAEFVAVGMQAALSQSENEFPEYGQGAAGYGKRYGANLGDQVSAGFFADYLYPVVLKEDPRYFRLGNGSLKRRIGYSLTQTFVCHTDKGKKDFNWSNVMGAVSSGALSNAYYPQNDRGASLTLSRTGVVILYDIAGALANEFWPDIDRKFFHREQGSRPGSVH